MQAGSLASLFKRWESILAILQSFGNEFPIVAPLNTELFCREGLFETLYKYYIRPNNDDHHQYLLSTFMGHSEIYLETKFMHVLFVCFYLLAFFSQIFLCSFRSFLSIINSCYNLGTIHSQNSVMQCLLWLWGYIVL